MKKIIVINRKGGCGKTTITLSLADYIIENKLENRTLVVFNKVRKPYNKSYYEVKSFWKKNYPKLKVAKQELSQLRGYQDVLAKPISGKSLVEMNNLIKEIKI